MFAFKPCRAVARRLTQAPGPGDSSAKLRHLQPRFLSKRMVNTVSNTWSTCGEARGSGFYVKAYFSLRTLNVTAVIMARCHCTQHALYLIYEVERGSTRRNYFYFFLHFLHTQTHTHIFTFIHKYVCIYLYTYYMCVYMYKCLYMYI